MVTASRINRTFKQQQISCVLASYAVVANYFTSTPIEEIFKAYCDCFHIPFCDAIDAENSSADHLNHYCKSIPWQGYRMVAALHDGSGERVFIKNRKYFSIEKQEGRSPSPEECFSLVNVIQNCEALINRLMVTQVGSRIQIHSQTIGMDNRDGKEFLHDTGDPTNLHNSSSSFINPTVREFILYKAIL